MRKKLICFATMIILALSTVFVGNAEEYPEVGEVFFQGVTIVGRSLYGVYTNKNAEGEMSYKWLRGKTKKGEYTPIAGAVSRSYTLTKEDAGKYIKFELTNKKSDGTVEVTSTEGYPVAEESAPVINNVKLHGNGKSNEPLWVEYHFSDENGEPERNSYFRWQVSDDGLNFKYIDNELKQSFVPADKYVGKYIRATVRADKLGSTEKNSPYSGMSSKETFSKAVLISAKPAAEAVSVASGEVYKGIYTYKISNNTKEGASKYFWEIADSKDGKYEVISKELILNKIQTNKNVYLRFSVIPISIDGVEGDKISSQPIIIEKNTSDNAAYVDCVNQSEVGLKFVSPRTISGMILHIKGNADDVELESSLFDISKVKEKGMYIFTFSPKENDAVYADDVIGTCNVSNNKGISIDKVYLFEYGDNNVYTSEDSPVTFDIQPVSSKQTFQRTVHHYSDETDTMVMIVAVYDQRGKLIRAAMSEEKTLTGYRTETFSVTCEYNDTQTVKSYLLDINTLKPHIKVTGVSGGYVFDDNKTNFGEKED